MGMDARRPPDDGDETPGPIRLPRTAGGPAARRLGWPVGALVVVLAAAFYFGTRPPALNAHSAPQPRWGKSTLAEVARGGAKAAGEPRPRHATWMFGYRNQILAAMTGHAGHGSEAEYAVVLHGTFQSPAANTHGVPLLPGSGAQGSRLVLLVRAFDGQLRDQWLGDHVPQALGQVGIVHPLRLGGLPFGL